MKIDVRICRIVSKERKREKMGEDEENCPFEDERLCPETRPKVAREYATRNAIYPSPDFGRGIFA